MRRNVKSVRHLAVNANLEDAVKAQLQKEGYRVDEHPLGMFWWVRMDKTEVRIYTHMGDDGASSYEVTDCEEWAWVEALEHFVTIGRHSRPDC
jgi:hypothetical protein